MSNIQCERCGGMTNTALCDWVNNIDAGKASRCFAKWDEVNKCWKAGCAMGDKIRNEYDAFSVAFAKKYINKINNG